MTAISWETDYLREPVLDMLRSGLINSIELDLKDESGIVGYDSEAAARAARSAPCSRATTCARR